MTKLTLSVPLPAHQHHSFNKRLLGLPLELRNLIYYHALVSPPKYSRHHLPDCHYRYNHTRTSIEPAACLVLEPTFEANERHRIYPWDDVIQCRCAKRTTLNLLLANRQVHHEAAPVFWSRNVFVFEHPDEFTLIIGSRLRPAYRRLLRHVYIASAEPWDTAPKTTTNLFSEQESLEKPIPRWLQFWGALNQCKALRTLAVRPEVVRKHAADVASLAMRFPELRRFELTVVMRYKDQSVDFYRDWGCFRACAQIQRDTVFVRASKTVAFRGAAGERYRETGCKELYRDFTTNFCVHVDSIVRERFLGCDMENREFVDLHGGKLAAGLDDLATSYRVELPTGEKARIEFMGVPQSRRTRLELLKGRLARDARARAEGKPTAAEEKLLKEVRWRKNNKKEQEASEELCERMRVLGDRVRREREMEEEEKKVKERERAEVRRAVEERMVERRLERKRVKRRSAERVEEGILELSL
ncbi:hypothetical protein CCHL11_08621 [Colletotrichum chlorophyti]|uniref:DUF7730 domain-containing protein n=1 Tax=Colletotrichum chlorophyti TaxID=708187 RepID=A0A1Q8RC57_9PEZI|nr:hypothetical protein CCHL11_08621 [Colletotrichum chlorophyti]